MNTMSCSDENIITLILQPGERAEYQAMQCLMKCTKPSNKVLRNTGLNDPDEQQSIFYESLGEFFIQVRKRKFEITGKAAICTYVIEIAKRKRYKIGRIPDIVLPEHLTVSEEEPEDYERLHEALHQLRQSDQHILTAFYFYNQPLDEYAKMNGISYDAAKKRIDRARERLKEILKKDKN